MQKEFTINSRLLVRNTVLNFTGQVIPLFVGIITIPFIIHGLGAERFGILSLAWIVIGYFSFFDLGLGRATTKFVAEALGKGQIDKLPHLIWTSLVTHLLLGLIGGLILAVLVPLFVEKVFNIPAAMIGEAKSSFIILSASIPLILISTVSRGVLEANQRFDLVNAVHIPSSCLTFLLPALGLLLGFGLPGILVLLIIARLGTALVYLMFCLNTYPTLKRGFSFNPKLIMPLASYGGWITVSNVVGPALTYSDRFLIGSLMSMAAVAYYTVPFDIVTRLWIIPTSLVMTLFPTFSALGATRREDLKVLYIRALKYLFLGIGPMVLILIVFAGDILRLWLGMDFARQSTLVFQILLCGALFALLGPVPYTFIQGLGRPDIVSKLYLIYLIPNTVLLWFLIRKLGIVGAALSFTVRALIDTVLLFIISPKLAGFSYASFVKNGVLRSIIVLCGLAVLLWITSHIRVFLLEVSFVAILILFFTMVSWRYVLDEMDKKVIMSITDWMAWLKK